MLNEASIHFKGSDNFPLLTLTFWIINLSQVNSEPKYQFGLFIENNK